MRTSRGSLRGVLAFALIGCQPTGDGPPVMAKTWEHAGQAHVPITPMQMLATEPSPIVTASQAPWTLTASDGSGLLVTRVDAKAVVEGPLAFTELHLYFHNSEDRTREGTFAITLPSGAAVSRFAMENAGQWQEAEVVEKAVARRAYDDFLHRKQDPALLEKAAGNQFSAKVFPIPAKADKHLVISFSQELSGRAYELPLRGLPKIERVDVSLVTASLDGSHGTQSLAERNWQPDRDFVANLPATATAVASDRFVVGVLAVPQVATATPEPPHAITLFVDTSASRALGFADYVKAIRDLVGGLVRQYGEIQLQVIAFDQDAQRIFEGPASQYSNAQDQALLARGAAGASNLAQALASAQQLVDHLLSRVVVVTDGVITAGPDTKDLVGAIKALPIDRLDVVLAGGIRDERLAASIARAGLAHAGDVYDLDRGIATVAAGLGQPVLVDVKVEVANAEWVYPKTLPAARPGSAQMVFARLRDPQQSIDVSIGGTKKRIGLQQSNEALVSRAVAGAEIEEMENRLAKLDAKEAKDLRETIAKKSVAARVISSQTSMLVLESDADYARYKIDRTSLTDILVVGPNGTIEQSPRVQIAALPKAAPDRGVPTRDRSVDAARRAGALADPSTLSMESKPDGAFASLTGTGDISSGFDDKNVYGGLLGNEVGEMEGGYGYGREGFGPGGGGQGEGTIGLGRYGTIGQGQGTGQGYGVGGGRGGMRGRTASVPTVTLAQPTAEGGDLDKAIVRRYIKRNIQKIQYCYEKQLLAKPNLAGNMATKFTIMPNGTVGAIVAAGVDPDVASCVKDVIDAIEFPRPRNNQMVTVTYPLTFRKADDTSTIPPLPALPPLPANRVRDVTPPPAPVILQPRTPEPSARQDKQVPLTGKLAEVMKLLGGKPTVKSKGDALAIARAWHAESPGDVLALIALGESLEATNDLTNAARFYGSIIDLYSTRADFRRFAGERLERLGASYKKLAVDTYRRAVEDRPDHITGHRLLAYALLRDGDYAGAFTAILAGIDQKLPPGRYAQADRVVREDGGLIGAMYATHGGDRAAIVAELAKRNATIAVEPSTRFIMYWETDANDVDFHIRDAKGGHAWYESKQLPSGGDLYADITTGYGPECFAIQGKPTAGPYELSINYFSQGPMGYGMGLLQIVSFDGTTMTFDDRPYVIMVDQAFVKLGTFTP